VSRSAHAFLAPVIDAEARLSGLRLQQREGIGELRGLADAIAAIEAETQPFVDRFQLATSGAAGPVPLWCAARWVEAALAEPAAPQPAGAAPETARANAVLLLAAALDGRAATESVAAAAMLPVASARQSPPCDMGGIAALSATAALMGDARQSLSNSRKNEAVLALMQSAGWQWAGAMLLGFGLLLWSRRPWSPAFGVAGALALWAIAAWLARVPWPLAGNRGFEPARLEQALWSPPAGFVLWLCAAAALLLFWALGRKRDTATATAAQAMSSRIGYAGVVLATGLGWLLLLDLSANGHPGNRYLALYHQGHLWLGLLVFSVLLFLRQPLSRGLGWTLAIAGETARRSAQRLGSARALAALSLLTLAAVAVFGLSLSNMRQLTSELGRVWLIVGAAWFFFLRAGPLAERLARSGPAGLSFWRYVWPLLFVIAVLIAAMLITRDMGPLLIAGYASGAFLAATVAMWWYQRSGHTAWAFVLAVALFAAWIGATTVALFKLGSVDSVTATRLESLAAPFASTNDQLALVSWFQHATPKEGFGIGAAPWCGYAPAGSCSGVPAQIHSDYTFTAIVGVFGAMAAWAASLGCAVWLHRLIRHHGRVTRGEPRLIATAGHIANDGQALLSWVGVAWVVLTLCQLAVTVAGNLAVLPLTGVTFPFVSFGMTSLLVNLAFLALCLNVNLPARGSDG
ncbi:FtsW/RodA/SpoVE family cell cycle protein, partial [Piscinibacter sp.]|uniref:FtsW/RodA/SpoVE family cell cycle protein n=1 Tax=Piscinibacter sp. TaxID=1903157 RepID=UPI002F3FD5A3